MRQLRDEHRRRVRTPVACPAHCDGGRARTILLAGVSAVLALVGAISAVPGDAHARARLVVAGDSVGANLADGLRWALRKDRRYRVYKDTKAGTGLARPDVYNWHRQIRRIIRRRRPDVMVVMLGGNDRQDMIIRGRRLKRFTRAWYERYERRVIRFAKSVVRRGRRVYWVGLPEVSSKRMTRDYARFNEIFRRVARRYRIRYIDTRGVLSDRRGRYQAYGPGVDGSRVRLRLDDGIHLTRQGSRVLGQYVARYIRRGG